MTLYNFENEFDEDFEKWKFKMNIMIGDLGEKIGYIEGMYIEDVLSNENSLEDLLDEDSEDGYELFEEIDSFSIFTQSLCFIKFVFINPEYRCKGIMTESLKYIKKAFRGYDIFLMPVDWTSEDKNREYLREFYTKRGFNSICRYMVSYGHEREFEDAKR